MSRAGDDGLESLSSSSEDEIIEVRATSRTATPSNPRNRNGLASVSQRLLGLILPIPTPAAGSRPVNPRRAASRGAPPPPPPLPPPRAPEPIRLPREQPRRQGDEAPVIDLTDEPDSPVNRATPQVQQQNTVGRNPRRTNSQRASPPRLSRSDSTLMGQNASVIDLTMDSPEDEHRTNPEFLRARQHQQERRQYQNQRNQLAADHLYQLGLIAPNDRRANTFAQRVVDIISADIRADFRADIFRGFQPPVVARNHVPARPSSPKPAMEDTPSTKEGFTRNTCANPDEEMVVVCPCCNEELAYDPNESAQSAGTKKRKRVVGEHHFWALKKCGHVYCAECFENRRPNKALPMGAGFRLPPGKTSTPNANEIRCVVENCDTKAAAKTEWVGIFL
ncbi:hypothetical protein PT974_04864 [Cladobotryum mycophilum]|uniref:Cell cycle control protein n=1 Tax=Cladobotryum mycophilum TaxID=491253 RepID=A0ABR0SQD4_9HYPO